MLNSIEKNEEFVKAIYKGDDMIWEMPEVMTSSISLSPGTKAIEFSTYPSDCYISIELNGKMIFKKERNVEGHILYGLESPLIEDDKIIITIKKSGWKTKVIDITIY